MLSLTIIDNCVCFNVRYGKKTYDILSSSHETVDNCDDFFTKIFFEILNQIQLKEDLFLLQEKFVKLKEDGPTVVQLMAPSFQVCLLT